MLRALVLLLVLANAGWYAWSQGWLPAGWLPPPGDAAEREPQRLARQVRPEAITLRPVSAATPVGPAALQAPVPPDLPAAPAAATVCLQTGPLVGAAFDAAVSAAVEAGASAWARVPAGSAAAADADDAAVAAGGGQDVAWLRIPAADADTARRLQALTEPRFSPCP